MKPKIKTIQIEVELHNRLKVYCKQRGLKLGVLVESLIKDKLDDRGL
jgi:hypothetical protein